MVAGFDLHPVAWADLPTADSVRPLECTNSLSTPTGNPLTGVAHTVESGL